MIGMKKNGVTLGTMDNLCYTEDMESGTNRVSVAKTIRIPPRHNGAISVSIRGHDIKTPTACFIGSQYTDPEVKLIDRVHDISLNTTLQVLVINNSNQHMNFLKGMKIGHLEPQIDELTQTVKPDSFTPPKYQLDSTIRQQLDNLLGTVKDQFAKDKMTIGTTPLTQMSIDTVRSSFTKTVLRCNETLQLGKGRD